MNQFEVYSHPDFQGTIVIDEQFPMPKSDKSHIYHIARMQWFESCEPPNLSMFAQFDWQASSLCRIKEGKVFWLDHCDSKEEAVALYQSVKRDDLDILAFFDGNVQIIRTNPNASP